MFLTVIKKMIKYNSLLSKSENGKTMPKEITD